MWGLIRTEATPHDSGDLQNRAGKSSVSSRKEQGRAGYSGL